MLDRAVIPGDAMESWKPNIEEGPAPLYERIADAIERDIRRSDSWRNKNYRKKD